MDVSKLPKLSQSPPPPPTDAQPPGDPPRPTQPADPEYAPPVGTVGAEVFFSLVIGVVAILFGKNFISFLIAVATGHDYVTGLTYTTTGAPVPYSEAGPGNMLTDLGLTLIGLTLLIDAFARVMRRRPLIGLAFLVSAGTALFSAFAAVRIYNFGILPIYSLLGLALTGYFAITQWHWLQSAKPPRQVGRS
jgi:hypothetical protein